MTLKIETCQWYEKSDEKNGLWACMSCGCEWCSTVGSLKFRKYIEYQAGELSDVKSICSSYMLEVKKLKEENETLKKLNKQLEGKPVGITDWEQLVAENEKLKAWNTQIIEMQVENEKLMKTMEGVIAELKEENEKLKFENGEIGQLNEIIEAKDRELEHIYQLNYKLGDKVRALQTENAQLKAKIEQLSGISGQLKTENARLNQKVDNQRNEINIFTSKYRIEHALRIRKEEFWREENAQLKAQLQSKFKAGFKIRVDFAECKEAHTSEDVVNCFACLPKWYLASDQRIKELQEYNQSLSRAYRRHVGRIELLSKENAELRKVERKPHKCPVCNGSALIPAPSHPDEPENYTDCRACESGIIWEPK
jgi:hypothetical protein